jgi:hypothetical protein
MAVIVPGREQNEKDAGEAVCDRGGGKLSWAFGRAETIWAGLTALNALLACRQWLA